MNVERTLAEWEDGSGRGSVRARVCSASVIEGRRREEGGGEREVALGSRERERAATHVRNARRCNELVSNLT